MIKYSVIFIISIFLLYFIYILFEIFFLNYQNGIGGIKIITDNEVMITEEPLQIDASSYLSIKNKFGLNEVTTVDSWYGALKPKVKMALGENSKSKEMGIYFNGCEYRVGKCLLVQDKSGIRIINDRVELKKYFSPIESKEEALSYLCAATGLSPSYSYQIRPDYRKFVDSINTTAVIQTKNGFEINLEEYEPCGCGPHTHNMLYYEVSFEGDISQIKRTRLYEDPEKDGLCID
jgi:hypothetical protein